MFLTPLVVRAAPFALSGRTQGATARHVTTPTERLKAQRLQLLVAARLGIL